MEISNEAKNAILNIFANAAWTVPNGQEYYDALADAFFGVSSISAVYSGGSVEDTTPLDDLKADLVVTATMKDSTTQTVPSTDYVLSGTLEAGLSTVTVSYSGKTTTFTVTVTEGRDIPTQYTWLYEARNGVLLSNENYVSLGTGGSGGTETLVDNDLVLNAAYASQGTNYIRYMLTDDTTANAKLSCRAKPIYAPLNSANATTGFRIQLSNGTKGAQAMIQNGGNNKIAVIHFEGSTRKSVITNYLLSEYHVFEIELSEGHQIFRIDGTQIFDVSTLSTNYCTANAIFNQASTSNVNPNGVLTNIDWVAYYEV